MRPPEGPSLVDEVDQLYRAHRTRLLRVASRFTRNHADAEDAVHEAFVAVLQQLTRERPRCAPAWLVTVTRYQAIGIARGYDRAVPAGDAIEAVPSAGAGEATNGGRCTAEPDTADAVRAVLDRLPLHHRQVLHLWCLDGLAWSAVAARLGMAVPHARRAGYTALARVQAAASPPRTCPAATVAPAPAGVPDAVRVEASR